MSRGCWHIKQGEIRRMIEAVQATGLHVRAVTATKDGIKVETAETAEIEQDNKPRSEWD
jgi:hypothetical protein